jgi:MYXO-CTERM domain-containing protein
VGNAEGSKRIDPSEPTDAVAAGGDGTGASSRPKTPAAQQAEGAMASGDPDALVESIETTREELSETLDAIADRVSPSKVKERTTARVKGAVKTHAEDAAATARGAAEQLKQSAEHFRESAGATAGTVRASTAEAVESVKEKVSSDDTAPGYSTTVPPAPGTPAAVEPPAPLQPSTTGMQTHTIEAPGLNPEVKAAAAGAAVVALIWLLRRRR